MAIRKSIWVLFGILAISVWVLGSALQAGAETRNYKYYGVPQKYESIPVADAEGHTMALSLNRFIFVFEDGEVASASNVSTGDYSKDRTQWNQYLTITFSDGSTVIVKGQGLFERDASGNAVKASVANDFIKGTGRFQGIKGTAGGKMKFLPHENDEIGQKVYGEGTWTYTLPSK